MKDEEYLYRAMPAFPWRRPVVVDFTPDVRRSDHVGLRPEPTGRRWYACRVCWGLGHTSVRFGSMDGHATHITEAHPDAPSGRSDWLVSA